MEDFAQWLGEQVGALLRLITHVLTGLFTGLDDFFDGLADSLGISGSIVSFILLALGVYLLYSGVRHLLRRALIGSIVRFGLAALLLGWLIN